MALGLAWGAGLQGVGSQCDGQEGRVDHDEGVSVQSSAAGAIALAVGRRRRVQASAAWCDFLQLMADL